MLSEYCFRGSHICLKAKNETTYRRKRNTYRRKQFLTDPDAECFMLEGPLWICFTLYRHPIPEGTKTHPFHWAVNNVCIEANKINFRSMNEYITFITILSDVISSERFSNDWNIKSWTDVFKIFSTNEIKREALDCAVGTSAQNSLVSWNLNRSHWNFQIWWWTFRASPPPASPSLPENAIIFRTEPTGKPPL